MQKIIYSDKNNLEKILENIKKDGVNNLHILADFDNTLTKAFVNGIKTPSLVSVVRGKNGLLGEQCAIDDTKLFEKYYPIEKDPNIPVEEKKKYMLEWWEKSFALFIKYGLSKNILMKIGKTDLIEFRDGIKEFFEFTFKNNIPVIIISASGLGVESIEYILENHSLNFSNIKIISNNYIWDENGKAIGYKQPIIHSFNKDETILENFPEIYKKINSRKNVILLGDSLGDHHMVDGFEYKNLIKIGFLNDKEEELLEDYKKRYDIVVTGDGDFGVVNDILNEIKK